MKKYIIIVAGGSGTRMQTQLPKQFIELAGKPVLMHTFDAFTRVNPGFEFVLALPENQIDFWKTLCKKHNFTTKHTIAKGGATRFNSVKNALDCIDNQECLIAVHDGVRPLVSAETIENCFRLAQEKGSAIPVIDIVESVRYVNKYTSKPVDRNLYKAVQTPQVFQSEILKKSYNQPFDKLFTDDASVVERAGFTVSLAQGNRENLKLTTPVDLEIAEMLLRS